MTQVTVSTLLFDLDMNFLYAVALLLSAASLGVYYSDLITPALEARRAAGDEAGHGGLELGASSGVILAPPASGPIFSDGWIAKRPAPDQETRRPWRRLLTGEAH